jgi:hypothetical protein
MVRLSIVKALMLKLCSSTIGTVVKTLKATVKGKDKKAARFEKKLIELELELKNGS